jgi:hypothetical protein
MMPRLAACVLLLILPSAVHAQEQTPLEIAILTCIAPGFIPDGDPYEAIARLPEKDCIRVCTTAARGCKAVVRTIDRCGVSFLRTAAKTGFQICRGFARVRPDGLPGIDCRVVRDRLKPDIEWWKAEGKIEKANCEVERDELCLSRCQSAASIYDSIPPPQGQGSVAIVSGPVSLTPPELDPPQGGAGLTAVTLPGIRMTMPALAPEIPEEDVREAAEDAIEFLESPLRSP